MLVLATTPVAVLMFRFNNPDALLTLLLVGSAYAALRAVESVRHPVRWLALAGALVGLAFLTKMLQAFLVIPALGLVYLLFAHTSFPKRLGHLLVGLGAMVASAGWWVAIVSLWPADSRPYIGGSQDNSILELTLGYNGFGRLTGNEVGSVGGGGGNGGMWGETGLGRLLSDEIGGQIGWLLPTALLLLVAGLWFTRRAVRTDAVRASLVVWGGWLVVTAATFSFMAGIFHAYYTVALAPAIGALVGTGAWLLWQHRTSLLASGCGQRGGVADDRAELLPARADLRLPAVAAVGRAVRRPRHRAGGRRPRAAAAAAGGWPRRGGPGGLAGRPHGVRRRHRGQSAHRLDPERRSGDHRRVRWRRPRRRTGRRPGRRRCPPARRRPPSSRVAAAGGLLNGSESTDTITALLQEDADQYTWVAAAVGSNSASGYQLASERAGDGHRRLQRLRPVAQRWRSSRSTWRTARSTTSSPAVASAAAWVATRWAAATPAARSPLGSRRTSPPRPWTASRSTT